MLNSSVVTRGQFNYSLRRHSYVLMALVVQATHQPQAQLADEQLVRLRSRAKYQAERPEEGTTAKAISTAC